MTEISLLVCVNRRTNGVACGNRGGDALADHLESIIGQRGWNVPVERILCLGECAKGPNARIAPGGAMFHGLSVEKLDEVIVALGKLLAQDRPAD